jgi:hypothetical protein
MQVVRVGNRAEPLQPDPSPAALVYGVRGSTAKTQAVCSFNQAAVLMDLISWAVMTAAPPP